jgi:hypothetical protein
MALSPRAHAVPMGAFVGGLVPVVALLPSSFLAEKWRSDLAPLRVREPATEPCEKQSWVSSGRALLDVDSTTGRRERPYSKYRQLGASRWVVWD